MTDTRVWSELARECETKGIEYSQEDDAKALRAKLAPKKEPKPKA